MISLDFGVKDTYRTYGCHHFIQKYGIPVSFNPGSNENTMLFTLSGRTNFINIQIIKNDIQNVISGYLTIENEKIPLFEEPVKLINGEPLIKFGDDKNEYPCVVLEGNTITIGFDIFNEVGHILSGYLEPFWKSSKYEDLKKIPIVDYYEKILFNCFLLACKKLNLELDYRPFWPNDKKFAVCLTHDVDRVKKSYQYITHTIRNVKKMELVLTLKQLSFLLKKENAYWNFEQIMEMEKKLDVKSTFFFLNEKGKARWFSPDTWKLYYGRYKIDDLKIIEIIKKLDRNNWEIGVHGSYDSYKSLKKLEEEKVVLEKILNKKIDGISQHYTNLIIPETWEYHDKIGLKYDSSLGFVDSIGFRWGTCHPFHPYNPIEGKTLSLWELPISIMDNANKKKDNWEKIIEIINMVEKNNGILLLRWHQSIFNELETPRQATTYKKIIEISKEKNAWIMNANSIVKWLRERENLI